MGVKWLQKGLESLRARYKTKDFFPKINWKLFIGLFLFGYIIHSFRITQMINAADDIYILFKGYGGGIISGRWALEYLGNLVNWKWQLGSFNLSVFDGTLTLLLLSMSACIILELFDLQHHKLGILFAAVFMVYPTCSATFLFMFTAAYYGLSCFLAVLAAYYIKTQNFLCGIFAVGCIAVSTGIYQAYFPVTVTLCLLVVIEYFLKQNADFRAGIKKAIYYFLMLCLGLASYLVILNNRLGHFGKELAAYQGLDSMGQLELQEIPDLIVKCYSRFLRLPMEVYHSINTLEITRKCIMAVFVLCLIAGVFAVIRQRGFLNRIMLVLAVILLPIAVNLIEIICSKGTIYELMVYPTVFVFLLPILFWKRIHVNGNIQQLLNRISGFVLAAILILSVLGYSWHANWNYVALDYMNRETTSYYTTLVTRIKSAEGYRDEYPVLFAGAPAFQDEQFNNPYSAFPEFYFECNPRNLLNVYSWKEALTAYTGFHFMTPANEENEKIFASEEYQEMNRYPDDGSIKVIDDIIVIKLID